MKEKQHVIKEIVPGSIAEELEIEAGDKILEINHEPLEDIFDYQFLIEDTYIEVLVEKPDGDQWLLEIDKDADEDLGIVFENGLMDDYRRCHNKCIFCFIDQMPKGMRETLYFKDDDSRLSFLQGNYVTLTNMSDHDVDRIIRYRLSPINISFQTMNPQLRCKMLNNRFAGEALKKADRFYEAGITMNGQIVLCKGVNDGAELEFSLQKLMGYLPHLQSVSVVPVGLSKYREGLYPLKPFTKEDAREVLATIHKYQKKCMEQYQTHFVHASDEWYILAGQELPPEENYDGYLQLENGVGMLRLLLDEFQQALDDEKKKRKHKTSPRNRKNPKDNTNEKPNETPNGEVRRTFSEIRRISLATGKLAYPYILRMARQMEEVFEGLEIMVYEITNYFFGEMITVSGLLIGKDIRDQLLGKDLGQALFLPQNVLRSGEDVFLDDFTLEDLEKALQVPINIVKSSGYDFVHTLLQE